MKRCEKVAQEIKKEVSSIIHDELKDPRLGFVTITRVELTDDLRFAKIFFSVLGADEVRKKTAEALDSALGFVRKLVSERIKLRFSPDMVFKEDRSSEYSMHIEEILNELKGREDDEKSG
ncbi:MAG: 30S ribosome-binding factor RbfA [Candidatus Omnitrophota bacterium]|jgi:ribosome-binding factor A